MVVRRTSLGDEIGIIPDIPRKDGSARVDRMDEKVRCDHMAYAGTGWLFCGKCGSTCTRTEDGKIDQYDRGVNDLPPDVAAQHIKERESYEAHHADGQ